MLTGELFYNSVVSLQIGGQIVIAIAPCSVSGGLACHCVASITANVCLEGRLAGTVRHPGTLPHIVLQVLCGLGVLFVPDVLGLFRVMVSRPGAHHFTRVARPLDVYPTCHFCGGCLVLLCTAHAHYVKS